MNGVIYARYSSDRQTEQSIEGQLRECQEYADANNIKIVGTYIDRANLSFTYWVKHLKLTKHGLWDMMYRKAK